MSFEHETEWWIYSFPCYSQTDASVASREVRVAADARSFPWHPPALLLAGSPRASSVVRFHFSGVDRSR